MEELSIEEKAKRYDGNYKAYTELINRLEDVNDAIKKQNYGIAMDILFKPYPEFQVTTHSELKESEDEEVRKEIVTYLKSVIANKGYRDIIIESWIAWLEKLGKCEIDYPQNHQDSSYPNGCIVLEDFNGGEGFYKVHLDYLNKKQVEEVEEMVRMWNKESKTSNRNIKNCIEMCLADANEQRFKDYGTNLKDCLSWLEKQGEQSPANSAKTCNDEQKFKVGDTIRLKNDGLEAKVTNIDESGFVYAACEDWEQIIDPSKWEIVHRTKTDVDEAMAEVERKAKLFTEANKGKTSEEILAEMRGEEPVSIWREASKKYPLTGKEIIVLRDNKIYYGKYIGGRHEYVRAELQLRDDMAQTYATIDCLTKKDKWIYVEDLLNLSNVERTVKYWKEPVSEDLGEYINELSKQFPEVSFAKLSRIAVRVAKWQKKQCNNEANHALVEQIKTQQLCYEKGMADMKQQMMKNIWKPADGDNLPEYDREVIALLDNGKVVFAHRPPEYWDGKNIITGKVTRNYPKTYDKGGWNIPDVKFWLDYDINELLCRENETDN